MVEMAMTEDDGVDRGQMDTSRSAFVIIASGESPVSNRIDVVASPRRTVTSDEIPCSAIRPTFVDPVSNCGAWAIPAANGAREIASSPPRRASYTLSTSVVTVTSSTGSRAMGSTATPGTARGNAVRMSSASAAS